MLVPCLIFYSNFILIMTAVSKSIVVLNTNFNNKCIYLFIKFFIKMMLSEKKLTSINKIIGVGDKTDTYVECYLIIIRYSAIFQQRSNQYTKLGRNSDKRAMEESSRKVIAMTSKLKKLKFEFIG